MLIVGHKHFKNLIHNKLYKLFKKQKIIIIKKGTKDAKEKWPRKRKQFFLLRAQVGRELKN